MKKLILCLFICSSALFATAQTDTSYRQLPVAKEANPLILIDSSIIISNYNDLNPNNIKSIRILKDPATIPASLKNLGKYGVLLIYVKTPLKLKTTTFKALKKKYNVNGDVKYALDGFFVDDESPLISIRDIDEVDISYSNKDYTVINIWTLTFAQRKAYLPLRRSTDKPGEIYIR